MNETTERQVCRRQTMKPGMVGLAFLLTATAVVLLGCGASGTGAVGSAGGASNPGATSMTSAATTDTGGTAWTASARRRAADFSGVTVQGDTVSLQTFAGKPLVLAFWASW